MAQLRKLFEKIVLVIITISILITFCATPSSYAKLELGEGEFYYSGTTKGSYVPSTNIFSWLIDNLANIADWILGIITLGFRMVFVGWAALIEKMLTWALETTAGVNADGNAVTSSTDLTSVHDATNNVTVQAIVFNHVPALNVDFFNFKIDKRYSATGARLYCDKCHDFCDKCCKNPESGKCSCDCGSSCKQCEKYMANFMDDSKPIIEVLNDAVKQWFMVIEYLSIAALLLVLIFIGIKMAITSIASEKAVYKRMMMDWLGGVIIVFAIPAIMWLILHFNAAMVEIVQKGMDTVTTVSMKQLNDNADSSGTGTALTYNSQQLEIDVYEAVRTRAYDAKLSVGLSGMLMYMTLVYFAIRYTIVYVKRYFTIMVLTIMGPAVGAGYALQKALHGKAPSFKNWFSEYFMNVFIQTIHAIIYGVFIASALVLSLQSIGGIILALILMNYSLKAEKTFRKIFKFGSSNSLADSTASAGDPNKLKGEVQNLRNTVGAVAGTGVVAKKLWNSPYAKTLKGAAKVVGSGLALGGIKAYETFRSRDNEENSVVDNNETDTEELTEDTNYEGSGDAAGSLPPGSGTDDGSAGFNRYTGSLDTSPDGAKVLLDRGLPAAAKEVADSLVALQQDRTDENLARYQKARNNYDKIQALQSPTFKKGVKGNIERLFNVTNVIQYTSGTSSAKSINGRVPNRKDGRTDGGKNSIIPGKLQVGTMLFGKKEFNPKTRKYEQTKEGLYTHMFPQRMLGIDKEDWKQMKQTMITPALKGLGGMASVTAGFGLIVAHPQLGMGMIAGGAMLTNKVLHRPSSTKKYTGRFTNARFNAPTAARIAQESMSRARHEMDALVVSNIHYSHPQLEQKIRADELKIKNLELSLIGKVNDKRTKKGNPNVATRPGFAGRMLIRGARAKNSVGQTVFRYTAMNRGERITARKERRAQRRAEVSFRQANKAAYKQAKFKAKVGGIKDTGMGYALDQLSAYAKKKENESILKFYEESLNYQAAVQMGNVATAQKNAVKALQKQTADTIDPINSGVDAFNDELLKRFQMKRTENGAILFEGDGKTVLTAEMLFGEKATKEQKEQVMMMEYALKKAVATLKTNNQLAEFFDKDGVLKEDRKEDLVKLLQDTMGKESKDSKEVFKGLNAETQKVVFGAMLAQATAAQNAFDNENIMQASQEILADSITKLYQPEGGEPLKKEELVEHQQSLSLLVQAAKKANGFGDDDPITPEELLAFVQTLEKGEDGRVKLVTTDENGNQQERYLKVPMFMTKDGMTKNSQDMNEQLQQLSLFMAAANNVQRLNKAAGNKADATDAAGEAAPEGTSVSMAEQNTTTTLILEKHVTKAQESKRTKRRTDKLKEVLENGILVDASEEPSDTSVVKVGGRDKVVVTDMDKIIEYMKKYNGRIEIAGVTGEALESLKTKDGQGTLAEISDRKAKGKDKVRVVTGEKVDFSGGFRPAEGKQTSEATDAIVEMLIAQRELDAINEVAKKDLKSKGNSSHNKLKKETSVDRSNGYRAKLEANQNNELADMIRKAVGADPELAGQVPTEAHFSEEVTTQIVEKTEATTLGKALKALEEKVSDDIYDAARFEAAARVSERKTKFHGPLVDSAESFDASLNDVLESQGVVTDVPVIGMQDVERKAFDREMSKKFGKYYARDSRELEEKTRSLRRREQELLDELKRVQRREDELREKQRKELDRATEKDRKEAERAQKAEEAKKAKKPSEPEDTSKKEPDASKAPDTRKTPETPDASKAPETRETPEAPDTSKAPETHDEPRSGRESKPSNGRLDDVVEPPSTSDTGDAGKTDTPALEPETPASSDAETTPKRSKNVEDVFFGSTEESLVETLIREADLKRMLKNVQEERDRYVVPEVRQEEDVRTGVVREVVSVPKSAKEVERPDTVAKKAKAAKASMNAYLDEQERIMREVTEGRESAQNREIEAARKRIEESQASSEDVLKDLRSKLNKSDASAKAREGRAEAVQGAARATKEAVKTAPKKAAKAVASTTTDVVRTGKRRIDEGIQRGRERKAEKKETKRLVKEEKTTKKKNKLN